MSVWNSYCQSLLLEVEGVRRVSCVALVDLGFTV